MGCLGVHFAITDKEANELRSMTDEDARIEHVQEVIEETYFGEFPELIAESDKAWDAMHRALTDGELTWNGGQYPLNHTVLAGEILYTEPDYILSLKTPQQVRDIAAALRDITQADFRQRYFGINEKSYCFELSEDDFSYTWEWFQAVRDLYDRAGKEGRYVLFAASQ